MSFACVKIPADEGAVVEELRLSKSGGLEKDALRQLAEETFDNDAKHGLDSSGQREAALAEMIKQGMSSERANEALDQLVSNRSAAGGAARLGNSAEIVCVGLATAQNHYRGVSMYCDGNASFKPSLPVNKRATKLAQAAGHGDRIVYGDAFFGRAHDDESCEWERVDFSLADAEPGAAWVREAAAHNTGRDMQKYTTSGSMQAYSQQMSGGGSSSGEGGAVQQEGSWTQTNDEVEVRYRMPPGTTSKQLSVSFTRTTLHISRKDAVKLESVPEKMQQPGGVALYDEVVAGDSTWSLDAGELVVTLAKARPTRWPDLC
jgi:hypothetical protein